MSREFGSYLNGYFHSQIDQGAKDCLAGDDQLTRLWGEFLREFSEVAYAISTSEAGDSGPSCPIIETIRRLPALKERLTAVEAYCRPFQDVAEAAVSEAVAKQKEKS